MRSPQDVYIWQTANWMLDAQVLRRERPTRESASRADELAVAGDQTGAATWRRITAVIEQLANNTPPGALH
jgi:hypothetical protein